ncbi:hypothetical protein GUJ93_ZPchr0458g22878, partial [Zizania palustris]
MAGEASTTEDDEPVSLCSSRRESWLLVHPLNKLPYSKLDSKAIGIKNGVIFVTYSSLIASSERGRSRLQQLVQWCGQEFDGLLVFDECHKAKNLIPDAGSLPTRTGKTVLEIQEKLPEARVVYCSATGASEPRNLGYMVRLGLWGDGTSFKNFPQFLGSLEKGGVGALELVAMDMKARICTERQLNFGLSSALSSYQQVNYLQKRKALQVKYGDYIGLAIRHMCMSAKVPAVVRLAKEALTENKCVVVGLQSTGEARTEEAVTKYGVEMEDFVSGEEKVTEIQHKRHSAPDVSFKGRVRKVARLVEVSDDDSDDYSPSESDHGSTESDEEFHMCQICNTEEEEGLLLHCSGCAQHVHPNCLTPPWTGILTDDCKDKIKDLDMIRSLDLPNNPLDDIIDQ